MRDVRAVREAVAVRDACGFPTKRTTSTIATIATILATEKVSIKNIGIIHNREFEDGVLKIEFYTDAALEQAKVLLTKRNYKICER